MSGTERQPPRCVALHGEIGKDVRCVIHPLRPSPCREFQASWIDGVHNERCDRARAAHGLPPLAARVPETPSTPPPEVPTPLLMPTIAPEITSHPITEPA